MTSAGVNLETASTALRAAFAWVPFVPRLARAAFTAGRDRAAVAGRLRQAAVAPLREPPVTEPLPCSGPMRVFLVAGEPSGDLHAANLAAAIRALRPDVVLEGVGGPRMAAAGVRVVCDLVSDPVMGVWPVVRKTPEFMRLYRDLLRRLDDDPPDVVVGIDYPGLNLRLAAAARTRGVPFVEYVAPQVWAWAPWRTERLARTVTLVLPILPFEQTIFEAAGARAAYVGHPLMEHLERRGPDEAFRSELRSSVGAGGALVALLPGSRRSEVRGALPVLLDAARSVAAARPGVRFVLPLAAARLLPTVEEGLSGCGVHVRIVSPDRGDDCMAAADAAITVSGTATLHLAFHGVPAVVVYRASAAGRFLSRLLLTTPWIALPNLVAGEAVLPEFLVGARDGARVADALLPMLPGGAGREAALAGLRRVRARLTVPGVSDRVARWVVASAEA